MGRLMTSADRLGPDHVCRRDDPSYASVGAWYEAHRGRVPIQAAQALSQLVRERQVSFADAFSGPRRHWRRDPHRGRGGGRGGPTVTMDLADVGDVDGGLSED
jgi:hypothetical protein